MAATIRSTEPEKGYTVGNLDSLDGRFKCTYCTLLLREPMQGDCGHRYCKNCVQIKFSTATERNQQSLCRACEPSEQSEISPDRVYQDNAIRREINKSLHVQCPNVPCKEVGLLSELLQHMPTCDFKPQPCNLCGQPVPAASLDDHRVSECPRRIEACDVCKEPVAFADLAEHKSSACVGSTIQCEFCLARVKDDKDLIDRHREKDCPAGWHDKNPCPFGCAEMPGGWQEHRLKCQANHLDRLMAKSKSMLQRGGGSDAEHDKVPKTQTDSGRPRPQQLEGFTDRASEAPAGLTNIPGAELSHANLEELTSLRERASAIERLLEKVALPAAALAGEAGDPVKAKKYLTDLDTAVRQGDKLGELLGVIKEQFDQCYEKIRQYELRMQKDLEKKLDIERKHQELVKLLAYKEMKILDLERRVEILEHAGYDGVLIWKITDVRRRKEEAREGKVCSIYSPPFYTGKAGYKMCGRLYLNGDGAGKNTHISLFFVIMRGAFDALLPWPFSKKVSMMLLDQNFEEHVIDAFKPDTSSSSFKRPTTDMNIASGCPLFMPLNDFESGSRGYVKDDTMFIKFIVDKSDLPT